MTDLRKAAEMALEALEMLDRRGGLGLDVHEYIRTKIEALRQALAQPDEVLAEREACAKVCDDICLKYSKADDYAERVASQWCAEAIRARSEKRPVKSYCGGKPNYCTPEVTPDVDAVNTSQERVDETAKREHEPYGYLWFTHQMERRFTHYRPKEEQRIGEVTPLYTAPPKREWVGLTDEEVFEFADTNLYEGGKNYGILSFGKAIEAKLKEKNT